MFAVLFYLIFFVIIYLPKFFLKLKINLVLDEFQSDEFYTCFCKYFKIVAVTDMSKLNHIGCVWKVHLKNCILHYLWSLSGLFKSPLTNTLSFRNLYRSVKASLLSRFLFNKYGEVSFIVNVCLLISYPIVLNVLFLYRKGVKIGFDNN